MSLRRPLGTASVSRHQSSSIIASQSTSLNPFHRTISTSIIRLAPKEKETTEKMQDGSTKASFTAGVEEKLAAKLGQDWQLLFREAVAKERTLLKTSLQTPRLTRDELYYKMKKKEATQQDRIQYLGEEILSYLRHAHFFAIWYWLSYIGFLGWLLGPILDPMMPYIESFGKFCIELFK